MSTESEHRLSDEQLSRDELLAELQRVREQLHALQAATRPTQVSEPADTAESTAQSAAPMQDRYRLLVEGAPDVILFVDPEGVILYANAQLEKLLGYAPRDVLGSTVDALAHPADSPFVLERFLRRVDNSPVEDRYTTRLVCRDGSVRWCDLKVEVIRSGNQLYGVQVVIQDVTVQVQFERQLIATKQKWRSLWEHVPDTITEIDPEGYILVTNREWLGLTIDAMIGTAFVEYLPEQYHELFHQRIEQALETGQPQEFDSHRERGLRTTWWANRIVPLRRDGEITSLLVISSDITERRHAEDLLRESQQRLDLALWGADLGLWDWHFDTREMYINARGAELTGLESREQTVPLEMWQKRIHPEDRPRVEAALDAHLHGSSDLIDVEHRVRGPVAGQWTWLHSRGKVVAWTPDGQALRATGIQRDVTGDKLAEEEREGLIWELERKNEELEQFTFTVSHDLKSPLITIQGFLSLLDKDAQAGDVEQVQDDIQEIKTATSKMGTLLDELLRLSRAGRSIGSLGPVNMSELVRDVLDSLAAQIDQHQVHVQVDPDLPVFAGDRTRLHEVVQNLIDNAVKFSAEVAKPQVHIGVEHRGDATEVFVRDNGMGIDPEYLDRVFGLFEKLDPDTPGSGVGLAIVKRIVDVLGGDIRVESAGLGQGTRFCLQLPVWCGEEQGMTDDPAVSARPSSTDQ